MRIDGGGGGSRPLDRGERRRRVLSWIVVGCALAIGFELLVHLTAVTLFTHIDAPGCAGTDTFCSPDGRPGVTGGAVVVVVGNLAAAVLVSALLVLRWRAARTRT